MTISTRPKSEIRFALIVTLVFAILVGVVTAHHEMWRDELQAWLIAARSDSPGEVLARLKYEGHPPLWHLSLFVISRFTQNPASMQVFHVLLAALSVFLFARYAPFTRVQRGLFAFGYFAFYEYAVIARNYAPGVLLLFVFAALFPKRSACHPQTRLRVPLQGRATDSREAPEGEKALSKERIGLATRLPLLGLILALVAQTHAYAMIVALSLCICLGVEYLLMRPRWKTRAVVLALVLVAAGVVTSMLQMAPPPDCQTSPTWYTRFDPYKLKNTLNIFPRVFLPLPQLSLHFWQTSLVDQLPATGILKLLLTLAIFALAMLWFARRPAALAGWAVGTAGLCAFYYSRYFGLIRHQGMLFIAFIVYAWIAASCTERAVPWQWLDRLSQRARPLLPKVLTAILCVHVAAGGIAAGIDLAAPFSQGKGVAVYLRAHGLLDDVLIAHEDYSGSTVAGYLNRELYYPRGARHASFLIHDIKRNPNPSLDQIMQEARALSEERQRDAILILNFPLDALAVARYGLEPLADFTPAIQEDEVYWLYLRPSVTHSATPMFQHNCGRALSSARPLFSSTASLHSAILLEGQAMSSRHEFLWRTEREGVTRRRFAICELSGVSSQLAATPSVVAGPW